MSFTVQTITTWDKEPSINRQFDKERTEWVAKAIADGKTQDPMGVGVEGKPGSFIRYWIDAAAAQEWKDFIIALGAKYGFTATVTII